jgi:alkylhydroperoxidase family enzyme
MPRIRPLSREEAAPELLPILDFVERTFGSIHAGTGIFAYCPPILQASHGLGRAVAASGLVSPLVRSLAMLRVAQIAGCPFRIDSLSVACKEAGASDDQIRGLADSRTSSNFSGEQRAALAFAEGMTQTPVDVSDQAFAAAQKFFDEAQLVELAAAVAGENYRVRFNRAFGVESLGLALTPGTASSTGRP